MFWIFRAARRLKQLGILSMNRRNAEFILDHNPRALFPLVDDKLKMRDLCVRIGVPTPEVFAAVASFGRLKDLGALLARHKPATGENPNELPDMPRFELK